MLSTTQNSNFWFPNVQFKELFFSCFQKKHSVVHYFVKVVHWHLCSLKGILLKYCNIILLQREIQYTNQQKLPNYIKIRLCR